MSDAAITGTLIALAGVVGAVVREWTLRRQRGDRIDAEAAKLAAEAKLDDATTLETVNGVVQGLIVVMQRQLNSALQDAEKTRAEVRQLRADLDAEKELTKRLTADNEAHTRKIAELETRLNAAEQENP